MSFWRGETVVGAQNLNDDLTQLISFSPLITLTEVDVRREEVALRDETTVINEVMGEYKTRDLVVINRPVPINDVSLS
jgi:hypothetical protein